MTVIIWHNPACGTSRNTLAMIRASGEEPAEPCVSTAISTPARAAAASSASAAM